MKVKPMNVQELIDLLQAIPDKNLPCFAFCDGNDNTYRFQRGEAGIAFDSFEDSQEKRHDAAYLLVLRCSDEP